MTDPGYGFVPLPPNVRREPRPEARWDRRVAGTLGGVIDLEVTAKQPVHVGSGSKRAENNAVILRLARIRGNLGIPGASFKGVLRARYEAITRSCAPHVPHERKHKIRSSSGRDLGIKHARLLPSAFNNPALHDDCTEKRACPACALFGRMSLRSRISVTDLAADDTIAREIRTMPERFGPNLHHIGDCKPNAADRTFDVRNLHGRKFAGGQSTAAFDPQRPDANPQRVETIRPGTILRGQLRLFNVTPAELGGLLAALGCEPSSMLKVGGGKCLGFGRMRCHARFQLRAQGEVSIEPAAWREAFTRSDDRWEAGEDQLVRLHKEGC